jgi:hypothetical protein
MGRTMDTEMKVFCGGLGILAVLMAGTAISHFIESSAVPQPAEVTSSPEPASVSPEGRPREWYIADQDFASCIETQAPAKKIELLRMGGGEASTNESRDSNGNLISVEVSTQSADGLQSTVWTYYTSIDVCQSALASRNHIPDEYR